MDSVIGILELLDVFNNQDVIERYVSTFLPKSHHLHARKTNSAKINQSAGTRADEIYRRSRRDDKPYF